MNSNLNLCCIHRHVYPRDILLSFPQMVVAIVVAGILKGGMGGAMIALGITMWVSFARLARSHTMSIRQEAYISASILAGKSGFAIIFTHVFPNLLAPLFTNALTQIGTTMIGLSGLSFLGLGVKHPLATWGTIINSVSSASAMQHYAFIWIPVGLLICVTVIAFNFVGDGLRDAYDPKAKR